MANPEHVEIVKQGKEAIKEWQREHPDQGLGLSGADLRNADLFEANLHKAKLHGANLSGANLSGATLAGADLAGADLTGANLSRADLFSTVLQDSTVREADFRSALVARTTFGDCDLSDTKNLDKVQHEGPSTIGIDTIYRSGGNIPEEFLRGAGVPETFITYARSLVGQAIQFYTCFISYASEDRSFAERLYADLRVKGVRCWYYPESSTWGRRVWEDIDRGIRI